MYRVGLIPLTLFVWVATDVQGADTILSILRATRVIQVLRVLPERQVRTVRTARTERTEEIPYQHPLS